MKKHNAMLTVTERGKTRYIPKDDYQPPAMPLLGEVLPPANPDTAALVHALKQPTEAKIEKRESERPLILVPVPRAYKLELVWLRSRPAKI